MEFIVAEVSKNWTRGTEASPGLLCQRFEAIIEVNRNRGYLLYSFQMHRIMMGPDVMNETIIAVFRRAAGGEIDGH